MGRAGTGRRVPGRRRAASVALAALAAVLLSGCTLTSLQAQYQSGDSKGYISGSGVTEISAADRKDPVSFSGTTEDGSDFSSAAHRGDVVVVNFWYAQCGPCRLEAKDLQKINAEFAGKGVQFVGVNTRDSAGSAQSFDDEFGVDYPSVIDAKSGSVQLAFSGVLRPNATPTTIVLDKQGRVAARIEGPINDQPSTLETLITSALAETESTGAGAPGASQPPQASRGGLPGATGATVSYSGYAGCAPCDTAAGQFAEAGRALAATGASFETDDAAAPGARPSGVGAAAPVTTVRDRDGRTVAQFAGPAADEATFEAELRNALARADQS